MSKYTKQTNTQTDILYNNILLLSRNKLFYTKFDLIDTFQNRINLIFIHISFIFIKIKQNNKDQIYKIFYQKMFDLIFDKIEINMREIGFGDTTINKNMRYLVKIFYDILINCENYKEMGKPAKNIFFNKYEAFCFDLSLDSVLSGNLNFTYR